jgi:hypothetical protein
MVRYDISAYISAYTEAAHMARQRQRQQRPQQHLEPTAADDTSQLLDVFKNPGDAQTRTDAVALEVEPDEEEMRIAAEHPLPFDVRALLGDTLRALGIDGSRDGGGSRRV